MPFHVRTSSRRRRVFPAATVVVLALGGCSATETSSITSSAVSNDATSRATGGSPSADQPASTDRAASTNDAVTSTAVKGTPTTVEAGDETFTVEVPPGWQDALEAAPAKTVLAAQSTTRTGDSFNTLVVTKGDSIADLDEVVAASIETLEADDADVRAASDRRIDGQKAYGFSTTATSGDDTITNRLRYVNYGDSLYTVTFSTSQVDGEMSDVAKQEFTDILDSWSWSSED